MKFELIDRIGKNLNSVRLRGAKNREVGDRTKGINNSQIKDSFHFLILHRIETV
jgi:hypothetical protein